MRRFALKSSQDVGDPDGQGLEMIATCTSGVQLLRSLFALKSSEVVSATKRNW